MPNNKDNKKPDSKGAMGSSSGREFEEQKRKPGFKQDPGSEKGQQAGGFGKQGAQDRKEDDDMNTAGGRKGQFSDEKRGDDAQWSPGSNQASDR
jgi:hypothetical protein